MMSLEERSLHAHVFFRERGKHKRHWRRHEMMFANLYSAKYHQIKRKVKTEKEWQKKFRTYIEGIWKNPEFALSAKQVSLFKIVLGDAVEFVQKNLEPLFSLQELLVDDIFWTRLNPLSRHQPYVSEELRQVLWNFVVRKSGEDTLRLLHWAIRLHLPCPQISALLDELEAKEISIDALHADVRTEREDDDVDELIVEQPTLLEKACYFNQVEIVILLLRRGAQVNGPGLLLSGSPLAIACQNGNVELVKLLLDRGADPKMLAMKYDYDEEHAGFPLNYAAGNGDVTSIKLLLTSGAQIDTPMGEQIFGLTPLSCACRGNHLETAKFLLDRGANVDGRPGYIPSLDAASKHIEMLKLLLARGAKLYYVPTALATAFFRKRWDIALFLLEENISRCDLDDENWRNHWRYLMNDYSNIIVPLCKNNPALLWKFVTHPFSNVPLPEVQRVAKLVEQHAETKRARLGGSHSTT